jgi:uncharacterized protein YggE
MSRSRNRRSSAGAFASACAVTAALAATPAAAQVEAPPAPHTISVNGSARVEPKPVGKKSDASIKKAVDAARAKAIGLAIADGRARAATLSQLTGLALGELVSIAETPSPFYLGGPLAENGSFGNGKYCDTVTRPITRRAANGRRNVVGTLSSRVCRVPRYITSIVQMVFSTA